MGAPGRSSRVHLSRPLNSRRSTAWASSSAFATNSSPGWPATSSRMRPANVHSVVLPTFRPKPRSTPRRLFSMSRSLNFNSLRAGRTARISCASIDLQCTGRNQPSRISCAIPRASLRSDFTGIALKASRTCRVSRSSTAKPASRRAAYSHCDKGPASSPIRSSSGPCDRNQAISASGSLATFASRKILPVPSTTQTLEHSKDTSIPA